MLVYELHQQDTIRSTKAPELKFTKPFRVLTIKVIRRIYYINFEVEQTNFILIT